MALPPTNGKCPALYRTNSDKVGHEATVTSFVQELGLTPEQAETCLRHSAKVFPFRSYSYLQTLPGEDILMEEGKHELGLIADFFEPRFFRQ